MFKQGRKKQSFKKNTKPGKFMNKIQANQGQEVKLMKLKGPVQRKKAKKAAKKVVVKSNNTAIQGRVVPSHLSNVVGIEDTVDVDMLSYLNMVESTFKPIFQSTDAILTSIPTGQWYAYSWYLLLSHIRRVGVTTGDGFSGFTTNQGLTLCVPFALAKYLEGLGRYKRAGVSLQSRIVYNLTNSESQNTDFAWQYAMGNNGPFNTYPSFYPPRLNLDQVLWLNGKPDVIQYLPLNPADSSTIYLQDFIAKPDLLATMSSLVQTYCPCVKLGDIPDKAFDASAYGALSVPPTSVTGFVATNVQNYCQYYRPELTAIYALSRSADGYTDNFDRPVPAPIAQTYTPWYCQLTNTLAYLAKWHTGQYRRGNPYFSFSIGKTYVKSFYHQIQFVDGIALSTKIASAYQCNLNGKNSTNPSSSAPFMDPQLTFLTSMLAVAQSALQRRYNVCDVDGTGYPIVNVHTVSGNFNAYLPCVAWCDDIWETVSLPPLVARHIDMMGPIVEGGVLRTPMSDYTPDGITTRPLTNGTGTNLTTPGFMGVSADGYQTVVDNYYGVQSLLTTGLFTTSALSPAGAKINLSVGVTTLNTFTPVILNDTYIAANVGWVDNLYEDGGVGGYMLNGASAQNLLQQFEQQWKIDYTTNVPPLIKVPPRTLGSMAIMHAKMVPTVPSRADQVNVQDPKYANPAGANFSTSLGVNLLPMTPDIIQVGEIPTAATALECSISTTAGVASNGKSGATRNLPIRYKLFIQAALPIPDESGIQYNMPYSFNPGSGAGGLSLMNAITKKFSDPNSGFTRAVDLINRVHKSDVARKVMNVVLEHLTEIADAQLNKCPGVEVPKKVPGSKSNASNIVKSIVQTLESSKGTATQEVQNHASKKSFFARAEEIAKKGFKFGDDAFKTGKKVFDIGKSVADEGGKVFKGLDNLIASLGEN